MPDNNSKSGILFILLYLLFLILNLVGGTFGYLQLAFCTKPLLLITLAGYFYFNTRPAGRAFRNLILMGLLFSLLGDILLMFEGGNYFIGGLVAFLIAHIFYLLAFLRTTIQKESLLRRQTWLIIPVLCYDVFYFINIKGFLGDMLLPVVIYLIVISLMLIAAINRYGRVPVNSFWLILAGAIFFIASDSILAINKFMHPLENSHFLIMSTYGIAQLLITSGALAQMKKLPIAK